MKRITAVAALATTAAVVAPAVASAHVTVNPREATAGSFSVMTVRVPNERDDKGTKKVDVRFPTASTPVLQEGAGLEDQGHQRQLETPVDLDGFSVDEQISRVTWTATRRAASSAPTSSRSSRCPSASPAARPVTCSCSGRSRPTRAARRSAGPARPTPRPRCGRAARLAPASP